MNTAHLHLLVIHLPIIGFAFGLILLAATIIRRGDWGMFTAAVMIVVISETSALAAQFTSEPAEEIVEDLAGVPMAMIETHEGTALIATILAPITTLLAIIVFFSRYLGKVKSRCSRSQSCLSQPW